jgi:heptosyltransferase-2
MEDNLRILIARTDRIGDVVLTTAIPREIKKNNPKAFVAVLVREYTKDIFTANPYVDEIIVRSPEKTLWTNLKKIRSYRFTHAVTLLPDKKLNRLFFLAGIKTRIVSGFKFYQFAVNSKSVFRRKYNPLRSEADYCMDAVRKIGIKAESIDSEICLTPGEKEQSAAIKQKYAEGKKKIIGVHVSSGNSAPNLKPAEYRLLIEQLVKNPDFAVMVTDNAPPKEVLDIANVTYPNIDKKLREAIVNLSALDVLISASTGPMHLAAALKVGTVSLFCPMTACSPILWGPLGNKVRYIIPAKEYCLGKCPGNPKQCDFGLEGGLNAEKVFVELVDFAAEEL